MNPIAQASVTFNTQMGKPRGRHAKILEKCDHVSVGLEITDWGWSYLKRKSINFEGVDSNVSYNRLNLCKLLTSGQVPLGLKSVCLFVCIDWGASR